MNKAILIGNLVADPETKTLPSGAMVCQFRIAVQRRFSNQQGVREADFLNIVTWRQLAELCSRYLSKGRKVAVEGSIQSRSYDAQDGSGKRYVTEIVADNVEFLGSQQGEGAKRADNPPPTPPEPTGYAPDADGFTDVEDDELPF